MPDNKWDTSLYDQKHAFVSEYGKSLVSLLDPQPGEYILDLGCGTGHLAKTIAESGARVVGIDSSPSMIEAACTAYPDLEFLVADARDFSFSTPFDAIFSNAALHWIPEAEQVVQSIASALKMGGRFVAELGGKGNVASITEAVRQALWELLRIEEDPGWYFPSIGEYTSLLEKYNLAVQTALLFDRPTPLSDGEKGLQNWLRMFYEHPFYHIPEDLKQRVLERTEEKLRDRMFKDGQWVADYRRLRIIAYKE
jgi:trans-aconitate methyltransferase